MKLLLIAVMVLPALIEGAIIRMEEINDMMPDMDEMFACKKLNDTCTGVPNCCNDMICFWHDKWSPLAPGRCISGCVGQGQRCQLDSQCCSGFQCDTDTVLDINGFCRLPRPARNVCHRDEMCEGHCDKRWYMLYGECED